MDAVFCSSDCTLRTETHICLAAGSSDFSHLSPALEKEFNYWRKKTNSLDYASTMGATHVPWLINAGGTKPSPLASNRDISEGSSQLQHLCEIVLGTCGSRPASLSPLQPVFRGALPNKPPAHKSLSGSLFPGKPNLWHTMKRPENIQNYFNISQPSL